MRRELAMPVAAFHIRARLGCAGGKVKESETATDLFAFLTTEPNAIVAPIHVNAMPAVLTTREEIEVWMTALGERGPIASAPLPAGALRVVARGRKMDGQTPRD
jgi:putative SOS response-associated peptidase YedK